MNEVLALVGAVLGASLLGSLHCAGMCGPFLLFAVGMDGGKPARAHHLQIAYHVGRLLTYTVLGVIAGLVGQALDFGGSMIGVQRVAALLAGALMIAFGLAVALRTLGRNVAQPRAPKLVQKIVSRGHAASMDLEPVQRALAIGLLTTLLPCGWLYAFAVVAAGTGHPALGALTMAAFWVGTLPVLVSLGAGLRALTGPLRKHVPLISSLAVMVVGVATVLGRVQLPTMTRESISNATPASLRASLEAVEDIDESELPCCSGQQP
ncbi:MAG: sulfite exporter TauE/SafE family protein [Leptolyngbya sp. PLA3]|nr:MAG: sulfite exporter TauE/SafE family protein [Cyanobacteria bacterium CYA]MCE7968821.1 sulfite exporter TauE/SafE family protein [Leptolyngbya sp. PL-A3]